MSENSQQILCGSSFIPMDELDQDLEMIEVAQDAVIESSAVDLLDNMGKPDFKFIYWDLIRDIKVASFNFQRRFIENFLEKMEEVYDFIFPYKVDLDTELDLAEMYEFVQFLEFENSSFIVSVWKQIGSDIFKIDIESFCKNNSQKIINESEKQLDSFDFNKKINLFLRTYYKEGFIKWFVENTKPIKEEIKLTQLQ